MGDTSTHEGPVWAVYDADSPTVFGRCEAVEFSGLACIRGVVIATSADDWRGGLTVYIPCSRVTRVIEYASVAHYRECIAAYYARKAQAS